jgi:hypothetical protein
MKLSMHGFQPLLVDVRVYLRGGNISVAEHFLYDSQVRSVAE